MKRPTPSLLVLAALSFFLSAMLPVVGFCAPVSTTIGGQDCATLKDFFARFEQEKMNKVPGDAVKRVLLRALPETYREEWIEAMKQETPDADESPSVTVRVLYVKGRKDERSIRVLFTFTLLSRPGSVPATRYDERLAALVIGRDTAVLSLMEQEGGREGAFVHILQENEVRIGGRALIGLNFKAFARTPAGPGTFGRQETVNFYLFQDNGVKFAGSVLKLREERAQEGPKEAGSVYRGAIVFKKDMKGNIVGILSPYTVTKEGIRIDKGMVRYAWDAEKEAFVLE